MPFYRPAPRLFSFLPAVVPIACEKGNERMRKICRDLWRTIVHKARLVLTPVRTFPRTGVGFIRDVVAYKEGRRKRSEKQLYDKPPP
jgi:hypothetical protein